MNLRFLAALLVPFAVAGLQWALWDYITPFVWFLFFPAAFLSAWIGGFAGGLGGTAIGALLVWYLFIPPAFTFALERPSTAISIAVFLVMGGLFSWFFERLRQAMARSDSRFEATFEQAAMGIALVAPDGRCLRVNRKLCAQFDSTPEELRAIPWQELTHPDDRAAEQALFDNLLNGCETAPPLPEVRCRKAKNVGWASGAHPQEIKHLPDAFHLSGLHFPSFATPSYARETRLIAKGGRPFWANIHVSLLRNAEGRPDYAVAIVEDVTQRKRIEEEVRQLNADLERRVAERTAELAAANRELESFAYAVSHDLRAPLRAMSGFSQALQEDHGDRLDGEARDYLDQIGIASAKMNELIDGLLVLSRCTRGELRHDPVDLSDLAQRHLAELAHNEPRRRVACQIEPGLTVLGDVRMLEAALGNLLGNAWKYSAHATEPRIRVFAEQREGQRWIGVSDNGAGFDMAHAAKLFQPFQRLHRQEEFPGIGIGLATVQRIIHRHGGRIEAEGIPGQGATFRFTLPEEGG